MFCIKCGNELLDDSIYCIKCGEKVDTYMPQPIEQYSTVNQTKKIKKNTNNLANIRKRAKIYGILFICFISITIVFRLVLSLIPDIDLFIIFYITCMLSAFLFYKALHNIIAIPRKERSKVEKFFSVFYYILAFIGIILIIIDKIDLFKEIFM